MLIEIVSHCYARKFPHYAKALIHQWNSLQVFKPTECDIVATVVTSKDDQITRNAIFDFEWDHWRQRKVIFLPEHQIGRRSIGRNKAALETKADIVWFADIDMMFGEDCLGQLARTPWPDVATMVYPDQLLISRTHRMGDMHLNSAVPNVWPEFSPVDFVLHRYTRAIGGVQIVMGDFAHRHGYLRDNEKFQRPAKKPFGDFRDDIAYRSFCKSLGRVRPIQLPNLFRIRHSTCSYDDKVQS